MENGRYINGSFSPFIMILFDNHLLSLILNLYKLYILYILQKCVSLFPSWPSSAALSLSSSQVSRPRETGSFTENWIVDLGVQVCLRVHMNERNGASCSYCFKQLHTYIYQGVHFPKRREGIISTLCSVFGRSLPSTMRLLDAKAVTMISKFSILSKPLSYITM